MPRAGPPPCDTSGTTEYLPTIPARTCGRARGRSRARSGPKTNHDRPGRTGPASASRKPRGCAPSTRRCRRRACRAAGRSPCGRGASPSPFPDRCEPFHVLCSSRSFGCVYYDCVAPPESMCAAGSVATPTLVHSCKHFAGGAALDRLGRVERARCARQCHEVLRWQVPSVSCTVRPRLEFWFAASGR